MSEVIGVTQENWTQTFPLDDTFIPNAITRGSYGDSPSRFYILSAFSGIRIEQILTKSDLSYL